MYSPQVFFLNFFLTLGISFTLTRDARDFVLNQVHSIAAIHILSGSANYALFNNCIFTFLPHKSRLYNLLSSDCTRTTSIEGDDMFLDDFQYYPTELCSAHFVHIDSPD